MRYSKKDNGGCQSTTKCIKPSSLKKSKSRSSTLSKIKDHLEGCKYSKEIEKELNFIGNLYRETKLKLENTQNELEKEQQAFMENDTEWNEYSQNLAEKLKEFIKYSKEIEKELNDRKEYELLYHKELLNCFQNDRLIALPIHRFEKN